MLVFYFLILGALFLGLGLVGSVLNGDRDFDRGFLAFGGPLVLLGTVVTSVATGSSFPLLVAAFISTIGAIAFLWGHYGNQPYAPPTWEDIKEVEKDPREEFRVALAKAMAGQAKAEARIRELENDKRALLSAAQHQQRAISDLIDRVAALEAKAETPKPAELLQDAVEMQEIFGSLPVHPADMPHPQWVQEPASA